MDTEEELVGDKECLQDIGGGGSSWYTLQVLIGNSPVGIATVPSSVFRYWVGSSLYRQHIFYGTVLVF